MKRLKLNPPQMIIASFLVAILIGTALLSIPVATSTRMRPDIIDSLFTATSATCVTGLCVKDTGTFFSPFGKLVILALIQIGGLGIMTFSTLFAIMLGRKLTMSDNLTVQSTFGQSRIEGLTKLIVYIIIFTFSIELLGAGSLYMRWRSITGWSVQETLWRAVFHSVSAFCNAGFSLFSDSLMGFGKDWVIITTFSMLIIVGGLGFIVFLDIPKLKFWRKDRGLIYSRISLQTKMVLMATALLIVIAAIAIFFFEHDYSLKGMNLREQLTSSVFTAVTPRTAGFNVLPTGVLRPATLVLLITLMFIGASPGSTGGGIKTVTIWVLFASFFAMLHDRDRITFMRKTIPKQVYRRAMIIFFLGIVVVLSSTFILSITETATLSQDKPLLNIMFEATSAFGTVGLSTGITPNLSAIGKLVVILTMFIGRVGPLTVAMAVAARGERTLYRYPEEKVMVG